MPSEKSYEFSLFNTATCSYVFNMTLFDGTSLTPKLHKIKQSSCLFLAGLEQLSPSKVDQIDELAKKKMTAPEETDFQFKKEMFVPLPKEKLDENGVKYHQCNVCNLRVVGIEHYSSTEHSNKLNKCEYFQLMMSLVESGEEKATADKKKIGELLLNKKPTDPDFQKKPVASLGPSANLRAATNESKHTTGECISSKMDETPDFGSKVLEFEQSNFLEQESSDIEMKEVFEVELYRSVDLPAATREFEEVEAQYAALAGKVLCQA